MIIYDSANRYQKELYAERLLDSIVWEDQMRSMYRGTRKFTREQLIFCVEASITAACEMIESGFPDTKHEGASIRAGGRCSLAGREYGIVETCGMTLGILYAQLSAHYGLDDGLGVYDALCSIKIYDESLLDCIERWVCDARVANKSDLPPLDPSPKSWAEAWVATLFPQVVPERAAGDSSVVPQ